jgi:hypothetical protein
VNDDGQKRHPGSEPAGRGIFVAIVSLFAAGIAGAAYAGGFGGVRYDSYHYFVLSRIVSTEGLWGLYSRVRMYGYPLFVAISTGFADVSPETARALVFGAQFVIYLAACFFAARAAEELFGRPGFFSGTFLVMALNPIALIHTTELLSDLLSAVLVLFALLFSIARGRPIRSALLAFLCAGLAVAVRPVNAILLPVFAIVWILRTRSYGESLRRAVAPALAAVALALLPQLYSNVRAYDAWTPLLVDRLYGAQAEWGMAILKYGTLIVPDRDPRLVYGNPFYPAGVASPAEFLRTRPAGYLATLGLHGFALFDQDLPFTFVADARPPYRWPLSLLNYAYLFLAGVGLLAGPFHWRKPGPRLYFAGALLTSIAYVAVYLPVAVESRFSLPLYLILAPATVAALAWLSSRRSGTAVAVAMVGAGVLSACVRLSLWLSAQAPALVELTRR